MIVAAVIDGWKLKVPNWLTFPLVLSGWALGLLHTFGLLTTATGVRRHLGQPGRDRPGLRPAVSRLRHRRHGRRRRQDADGLRRLGRRLLRLAAQPGLWIVFWAFCLAVVIGGVHGPGHDRSSAASSDDNLANTRDIVGDLFRRRRRRRGREGRPAQAAHAPAALWHPALPRLPRVILIYLPLVVRTFGRDNRLRLRPCAAANRRTQRQTRQVALQATKLKFPRPAGRNERWERFHGTTERRCRRARVENLWRSARVWQAGDRADWPTPLVRTTRTAPEESTMKPKTMILMVVAVVCGLAASYMTSRLLADKATPPPSQHREGPGGQAEDQRLDADQEARGMFRREGSARGDLLAQEGHQRLEGAQGQAPERGR